MRVLVLEDNFIAALELASSIEARRCSVVGPVATVQAALAEVQAGSVDCAFLDYRVRGGNSAEVARALSERNLPFCFITGYTDLPDLPGELAEARRLGKPVTKQALLSTLADFHQALERGGASI